MFESISNLPLEVIVSSIEKHWLEISSHTELNLLNKKKRKCPTENKITDVFLRSPHN